MKRYSQLITESLKDRYNKSTDNPSIATQVPLFKDTNNWTELVNMIDALKEEPYILADFPDMYVFFCDRERNYINLDNLANEDDSYTLVESDFISLKVFKDNYILLKTKTQNLELRCFTPGIYKK